MKTFTHPEGLFEIKIPLGWTYKNEIAGIGNVSPFSFELYKNTCGCFQISCYLKKDKEISQNLPIQNYNTTNLIFAKTNLPDTDFTILLWFCLVEEYIIMAKYVCQPNKYNSKNIQRELSEVDKVLSTLSVHSPDRRVYAIGFDRFEKFCASLAASFDLKYKAIKNLCYVQVIIINANQIDAYLRLSIVLQNQLIEKSDLIKTEYLYQSQTDSPILEKKIYDQARKLNIISEEQYKSLYSLYNERNKVVHRFIITDIKTLQLLKISYEYEKICEEVRNILKRIEDKQFQEKIGYYGYRPPSVEMEQNYIDELHSMVNDKHMVDEYFREFRK